MVLFQSGVTDVSLSAPTQPVPEVKRLKPETSDLLLTSRINEAVTPFPHTSSRSASIPRRIMCCGIHPEDDGNTVYRNIGKNSSSNSTSYPQKNNGIIDYTSLKTSQLYYVFRVIMSSLEFGVLRKFFFYGEKVILCSFLNKLILNTFLLEFP